MSEEFNKLLIKLRQGFITILALIVSLGANSVKAQSVSIQPEANDFSPTNEFQASTQYSLYLPIFSQNLLRLSDFVEFVPGKGWRGILGEVINGTTFPYSLTLSAVISDTISDTLRTETLYPLLDVTLPAQANPYVFVDPSGYEFVESVSIESFAPKLSPVYLPVTVTSKEYLCSNIYGGYMAGTVRNDNSYPVDSVKGYFWTLELYPTIGGMEFDQTSLQPGEETPFHYYYFPASCSLTVDMFTFSVQGVTSP